MLDSREREERVTSNLNLVHTCANRFRGRGVDYEDLFQAGCVGLIKSVDGFDESLGFKFSTYAVPVIIGEIRRIFRDGGLLKVGRTLKDKARGLESVSRELSATLGREPTVSELAAHVGMSVEDVAFTLGAIQPVSSLTVGEDSDEKQLDLPSPSPESEVGDAIAIRQLVSQLPEQEQALVTLRYFKGYTQQRTADVLGMTQVQVSRAEKKVLVHLRSLLE